MPEKINSRPAVYAEWLKKQDLTSFPSSSPLPGGLPFTFGKVHGRTHTKYPIKVYIGMADSFKSLPFFPVFLPG